MTTRSILRSPRLRRIVVGYTVNRLGTWFGYVALSLGVYAHTHSAVAVAGLLIAAQALPAFLVPPLVARVEASTLSAKLAWLYGAEALLTGALAALLVGFWLPAIYLLSALDGTIALAASALLRAEAARVARTEAEQVEATAGAGAAEAHMAERRANAALNIAFSLTFALGPVLAGALVDAAGGPLALAVDAASFLVAGALLFELSPHVQEDETSSVAERLRAAWSHVRAVPALRYLLIAEAVALVFFAADASIEVPYATVTLHAGDRGYGLILTVWGLGTGAGSLFFARALARSLQTMLAGGALAVGLAYVGFALAPSLAVACVASFVGGLGNGTQWASLISTVQQMTPPALHGRLMGAVEAMTALFPGMGLLLGGLLVAVSSPRTAFLVVGLGAAAMTFAFVRLGVGREPAPAASEGQQA